MSGSCRKLFRVLLVRTPGCELVVDAIKLQWASIRLLDLSNCDLSEKGADSVARLIRFQAIRRQSECWHRSLRYNRPDFESMSGLRHVVLNNNSLIGEEGVRLLAEALHDDYWITSIGLAACGLTDNSVRHLIHMLSYNSSIVDLNIASNPLISDVFLVDRLRQHLRINQGQMAEGPPSPDVAAEILAPTPTSNGIGDDSGTNRTNDNGSFGRPFDLVLVKNRSAPTDGGKRLPSRRHRLHLRRPLMRARSASPASQFKARKHNSFCAKCKERNQSKPMNKNSRCSVCFNSATSQSSRVRSRSASNLRSKKITVSIPNGQTETVASDTVGQHSTAEQLQRELIVQVKMLRMQLNEERLARQQADHKILELLLHNERLQQQIHGQASSSAAGNRIDDFNLLRTDGRPDVSQLSPIYLNGSHLSPGTADTSINYLSVPHGLPTTTTSSLSPTVSTDDKLLRSIEDSFRQFHAFLDQVKRSDLTSRFEGGRVGSSQKEQMSPGTAAANLSFKSEGSTHVSSVQEYVETYGCLPERVVILRKKRQKSSHRHHSTRRRRPSEEKPAERTALIDGTSADDNGHRQRRVQQRHRRKSGDQAPPEMNGREDQHKTSSHRKPVAANDSSPPSPMKNVTFDEMHSEQGETGISSARQADKRDVAYRTTTNRFSARAASLSDSEVSEVPSRPGSGLRNSADSAARSVSSASETAPVAMGVESKSPSPIREVSEEGSRTPTPIAGVGPSSMKESKGILRNSTDCAGPTVDTGPVPPIPAQSPAFQLRNDAVATGRSSLTTARRNQTDLMDSIELTPTTTQLSGTLDNDNIRKTLTEKEYEEAVKSSFEDDEAAAVGPTAKANQNGIGEAPLKRLQTPQSSPEVVRSYSVVGDDSEYSESVLRESSLSNYGIAVPRSSVDTDLMKSSVDVADAHPSFPGNSTAPTGIGLRANGRRMPTATSAKIDLGHGSTPSTLSPDPMERPSCDPLGHTTRDDSQSPPTGGLLDTLSSGQRFMKSKGRGSSTMSTKKSSDSLRRAALRRASSSDLSAPSSPELERRLNRSRKYSDIATPSPNEMERILAQISTDTAGSDAN